MGISDRKEREKQEMRKLIMNAAMEMFVKEGYEKTSLRNIADKIEYSPATIYLYYKDKDELLWGLQAEAFGKLNEIFQTSVTATDPVKQLEQLTKTYVEFGMNNPDLYDLMFIIRSPMNVKDDESWQNGSNAFKFLTDVIERCGDRLRYKDAKTAALSCWAMVHGLVSLNVRGRCKVLELPGEEDINKILIQSVDEYIELITR
ncbi:transcriptional regulator, TetR family [Chitinophaga sp. CF118]|uniref:TetR/AcrR family transcriptional regulator n=1 Tax=Chitinophaga sp. CF118 TaxID=1884367 RepID=UPI0008F0CB52|nr:TetR/AcrR family transcriptional regulator [Chitinophaga sp. CF118]SFE54937.1 transcriptional regulator, TetR family [Chitinophaga sp. CF118]